MTEQIHMSPTRAFKFHKNPLRALQDYNGVIKWWEGDNTPLLFGNIVHNLAEGRDMLDGFSEEERTSLISSRGKTKGDLKSAYADAVVIGDALRKYVEKIDPDNKARFEVPIEETDQVEYQTEDLSEGVTQELEKGAVDYLLTGRADMVTENAVYDFKTVAPTDFNGFLKFGSFRDKREEEYKMQVAMYAAVFGIQEAHILYIKKNADTPFIYDYTLTLDDLHKGLEQVSQFINRGVLTVAGIEKATAINDGSKWAYEHFGGVINDSQTIEI
ncbi:PD-(D/E)XK nuclease-like domain-containing protein [Weissella viridescens]